MRRPPRVLPAPRSPGCSRLPLLSALLALLLGWGYLATLLPGIGYSGDAIKFQYLGRVLGIPHAPGYPLYMVLNHLFVTLVPVGTLAYRANLLTALCAIGACLVLFKLLELLGVGRFVAFVMALTFGFSQTYWSQAIIAEVYALLVLFMVAVSFFLVRWHLRRRDRDFYLATALYALSFGHHLLAITLLPAFVYLVVVTDRSVFVQPKKVLWVLAVITLGAAQYLYLFWRLADPQTPYIEGFTGENVFHFVTGGPFKPYMFAFTPAQLVQNRLPLFLSFMRTDMPVLGLGVVGATFVRRALRPVRVFLLLYFLSNALYAVNYDIPDIEGYFLPNDLVLAIFAALALGRVTRGVRGRGARGTNRTKRCGAWRLGVLLLLPLTLYVTNYHAVDLSGHRWLQRDTEAALAAIGEDALIIAPDYARGQALLYYLIGYGWGETRNLHATNIGWVWGRLRSYLEDGAPLPTLGRRGPQAGLALYAFPCQRGLFEAAGLMVTRPADHLPALCRLEAAF
ncbi:glycosyltransferase family 117 protein [Truepera radiovictrix]|uniref:DUF2723 domain-containing protein n=1 Tax=Truepera radiovictrix (strain DSM 17093 / CIP 108686 / LMG 22925 / RQ-24) TaxID=649638 RepID=D7CUY5_TRURR|nr:DUF2723 domain-containing protein [Truepera radiovictrix]ADI15812.1 hypothetical protein Trad_2709 [Truepera radiovictrix DSM 17093]WMT58560.1 DUF2723 domain-containing protein [Truepera radiovictrix]